MHHLNSRGRQHQNALIAMEACGSSHHWARTFSEMGFGVRLIPAQHVKAFVRGNKNDALAIAESVFRLDLHDVQIKTLEQQDFQTLLRIRTRYKDSRKANANQLRGLLSEYGHVMKTGFASIILETSFETRKSTQLLNISKKSRKVFITLVCSCIREINASMHKTNEVTSHFLTSLSISISCTSFSRSTEVSRIIEKLPFILEDAENGLTPIARQSIAKLLAEHRRLSKEITAFDAQIKSIAHQHHTTRKLMRLRGVGSVSALALYASVGNGSQFKNARQLSAWLGLVPKQYGTGGKVQLGGISKRCNSQLRMSRILVTSAPH